MGSGGLEVHEAELVAVEDLAKPFGSPDEMRQMAQRRLHVQQSADVAAQAAVTPEMPVAAPSSSPVSVPQPTGLPLQPVYATQGMHEGPPPPAPKPRPEQPWLTRPIRGSGRPRFITKVPPAQHTVSSGGYHVLQDLDVAEESPATPSDSGRASASSQTVVRTASPTGISTQHPHPQLQPEELARKRAAGIRGPALVTSGPALLT